MQAEHDAIAHVHERVIAVANRATPVAERVLAQPAVSKAIAAATPYCAAIGKRVLPKPIAA